MTESYSGALLRGAAPVLPAEKQKIKLAKLYAELGCDPGRVNPLWVQRVAQNLLGSTTVGIGEAAVLLERCTTVRSFTSILLDSTIDLPEHFPVEPLQSMLLVPSAPLISEIRSSGERTLVLALAWDHGAAYCISMAEPSTTRGLELLYADMVLRDPTGLTLIVMQLQGKAHQLVKWLGNDDQPKEYRVSTAGERLLARKAKIRPVPFYIVKPRKFQYARDIAGVASSRGPLEFRFERRSHLRLLVERSSEPLEAKEGWQLLGPEDEPGPRLQQHLGARGHGEKQPREWMRIRIAVVKEHEVGPKEAPFIPSTKVKT